ncbi:hypothetical protein Baya_12870 [Bagarius yarrelli]|uniref:Uncharacterized protein n=1 Tax=Bagarius yarrelli TaxID=175774 RepID=A0A556V4C3_BAGYA|nr:hypothetical protein Baya_12870 [Bagarius yarrelli]
MWTLPTAPSLSGRGVRRENNANGGAPSRDERRGLPRSVTADAPPFVPPVFSLHVSASLRCAPPLRGREREDPGERCPPPDGPPAPAPDDPAPREDPRMDRPRRPDRPPRADIFYPRRIRSCLPGTRPRLFSSRKRSEERRERIEFFPTFRSEFRGLPMSAARR